MPHVRITKAEILRYELAFVLRGVRLHVGNRHLKLELTEGQRYEIADKVVAAMRARGWKELDEYVPEPPFLTGPAKNLGPQGC